MRSYKRRQSRLPRVNNRDITKRNLYVPLDLLTRLFSAISLAALGAAGWWFQVTTQRERDIVEARAHEIEERAREGRKLLPLVRSLAELEMVLDDVAIALMEHSRQDNAHEEDAVLFDELATYIDSAVFSTGVSENELETPLTLPSVNMPPLTPLSSQTISVRSSTLMLAQVLRIIAMAKRPGWCKHGSEHFLETRHVHLINTQTRAIIMIYGRSGPKRDEFERAYIEVLRESEPAWQMWLTGSGEPNLAVVLQALPGMTRAVRQQVATASQNIMRRSSELGEQFVQVRTEAMKSHQNNVRFAVGQRR